MKTTISLLTGILLFSGFFQFRNKEQISIESPSNISNYVDWNPDAGVIPSLTKGAKVIASSNPSTAQNVLDGNAQTHWISDAPFPNGFLSRADLNILYGKSNNKITSSPTKDLQNAFDGKEHTNAIVEAQDGEAFLSFNFFQPTPVHIVALSVNVLQSPIEIKATLQNGTIKDIGTYLPSDLNNLTRLNCHLTKVTKLTLSSNNSFTLKEWAAMSTPPKEFVTLDLGQPKIIGWIETRHWPGDKNASGSSLYLSADNKKWYKVAELNPNALHATSTRLEMPVKARYIKLEHTLVENDWNKVFAWKINAYDDNGPFGKLPSAKPNPHTFKSLLGVNAIWGWGRKEYADLHQKDQGADLYNNVATHARNYHFINWEVTDPDHTPDYEAMKAGNGTEAQAWLNWDREYKAWQNQNLKVHTAVKFGEIDGKNWDTPYESAYKYGKAFAKHFGPTHGNGLVDVMEIGNEPWYYDADLYRNILRGMAKGAKEADPNMFVLPCALHAAYPQNEREGLFKNYMGARITPGEAKYLDGINVHYYSWVHQPDGTRISVHPEHPGTELRGILNDIRFRDKNMPGKPIYLTEWGWDSDGADEPCTHSECVSEKAQALYAVRSLMFFARLGIDRMTWFFYANTGPGSSLFTRSGLTGGPDTNFKKKMSYFAFEALINAVGDKHFVAIEREDKKYWAYWLGDGNGKRTHLIVWRPVDAENTSKIKVKISTDRAASAAMLIDGRKERGTAIPIPNYKNGAIEVEISATPLLISF